MGIINPSQFKEWVEYRTVEDLKKELVVIADKLSTIKKIPLLDSLKPYVSNMCSKILS
jgi:hypothetical protein